MKPLNRGNLRAAGLMLALILTTSACHSTGSTEVGVLTRKVTFFGLLGTNGIQPEVYAPGATYIFPPLITDWATFDVSLQNLAMVQAANTGDRSGEDDVNFKTIDGNDIRVDVTVSWQIEPKKTPELLARVGSNTEDVKEKLVRPACRSIVRDVLNELHSEDFYVSAKRFEKATQAQKRLSEVLEPEGVLVSQVILGEHHFHPDYEQIIRDKKLAEQNSERLKSAGRAAAEEAKSKLEKAKGTVSQQLAEASGYLDTIKLQADAALFENQKKAEALVAEKKARAQAVRKRNEALAGAGGKTLVKLRLAEALSGKQIVFLPTSAGASLNTLNLNALLKTLAVEHVEKQDKAAPEASPPAESKED